VAVFEEGGEARVVLIRRAVALPRNPGEIAFPGGRVDPGEGMVEAALREAEEEVGLDPAIVDVVGCLSRVSARTSGSVVTPIVAVLPSGRPALEPSPAEVEAVFDIALSELFACYREERWDLPVAGESGRSGHTARPMHFFDLGEDLVWGMTARVLYELLVELSGRTAPRRSAPAPGPGGRTPPAPS
jgi:8-oxo-dGTP pyrophosphatase MutT (NUDIX family)